MIHHHIPCPQLAPYIAVFWLTGNPSGNAGRQEGMERVLPTGAMNMIINLHDDPMFTYGNGARGQRDSIDTGIISGAQMDYLVIDTRSIITCLGVVFKPGGAAPFFPLPLTELRNQCVSLDCLCGKEHGFIREQLLAADTPEQCFRTMEYFLLDKLHQNVETIRDNEAFIQHTVRRLSRFPGETSLSCLRDQCGFGATHFISLFSKAVGLTPKQFSRVQRFQHVLKTLFQQQHAGQGGDWPELALRFGYYDQAHFIHEFKDFTGVSPGNYFSKRIDDQNHLRH